MKGQLGLTVIETDIGCNSGGVGIRSGANAGMLWVYGGTGQARFFSGSGSFTFTIRPPGITGFPF